MKMYLRSFMVWMLVLLGLAVLLNYPRSGGSLKPDIIAAGFPWVFARTDRGRPVSVDLVALLGDIVVSVGFATAVAAACAASQMWRDRSKRRSEHGIPEQPTR